MADSHTSSLHQIQQQIKKAQEKGDKKEELTLLHKLGTLYISLGQFLKSIECHQKMACIAKDLGLNIQEGRAYFGIAKSNSFLNNNVKTIEYYRKCIAAMKGEEEDRMVRMACCDISVHYFNIRNITKSMEFSQKSLQLAAKAADKHMEMLSCFNLGKSSMALKDHNKAISYYQRALPIAQERADLKYAEKIACFLGDAYMLSDQPNQALKYHKETLEFSLQNDNKEMQKTVYLKLAQEYKTICDYPNEVECFGKYQSIAEVTGNKEQEVDGYRYAGIVHSKLNNLEAALECFRNSLRIAVEIEDKEREGYGHANVAKAYTKLGKHQLAIEHFEKSLKFYIEKGDRKEECKCYLDLGKVYVALGRHEESKTLLNKCIEMSSEMAEKGDKCSAYEYLGDAYYQLGRFKEAKRYYEMFLSISLELKDKLAEQEAINKLGVIYKRLNCQDKAIECLEKTLQYAADNSLQLVEANVSCNLGNLYTTVGRYQEAFDISERALRLATEARDIHMQGTAHLNISRVHHVLANRREEVNHAKLTAEIAKKSGDKRCEELADRALATIANVNKDYSTIMDTARKQLELAEKSSNKYEEVFACLKLGRAHFLLGNYEDANKYLEKSVELAREIGNNIYEGEAYEYLGYVNERLFEINSSNKAFQLHERHLQISQERGNKVGTGKAYRNLGALFLLLYLKEKSPEYKAKAECYLKESLRSYDSFFQDLEEEDEHKINVIETFLFTHKLLVDLYIEAGDLEKALLVSEQERGRALEDILKRRYMLDDADKPTYDFLGYGDIESKVLNHDANILFFSDMMKKRRNNFELQVGTWVLDLENHVSFYRNELQQIKSILQEEKLDEELQHREDILCALVDKAYFTISVQRSVDSSEDRSFSVNAGRSSAENLQDSLNRLRCVYDEELNENYLEVLYDILIAPIQDRLIRDEIVIIPNGSLFRVPFAALRNQQTGSYLFETKRLRIAPSLNTLKIMKESSAESHSLTGALIVGNPDVNGKRILRGKERTFHSLPNAKVEAEKVGEVLGVEALTGKQASKQVIIERLRQGVAVIHFAAHGCAETGEIILCPSSDHPRYKIPDEEDYLLTISEVQELGLRARLVVLSCCHSGRGEIKSEGVIGMSRAFLAAGALAVVASLWAVDDEGTRVFMEQFYTHLRDGKTASTSLQQAMKDMRNMPRFDRPMYWAPFVLIGEDVTIDIT